MKKLIILLITILMLLVSCTKTEEFEEIEKETITAVKTETASKSTLYQAITTNGNVQVEASLEVYSVISGRVVKNQMALGKQVKKGDLLAVIDPSVTGGRYALYEVTAPMDGTILSNSIQTGSIISPETRLTVIGDLSNLQITAYIPERFYGQLKTGLKADLSVEAYPGETFGAKIKFISPVIDENSRTCEVVLELDKNTSKIVAGMFADVKLYLKAYENVISVPANCISNRSGENFVYLVGENNQVELKKIETAETLENRVIVTSGLYEKDTVITEGFETLVDGAFVNIISAQ